MTDTRSVDQNSKVKNSTTNNNGVPKLWIIVVTTVSIVLCSTLYTKIYSSHRQPHLSIETCGAGEKCDEETVTTADHSYCNEDITNLGDQKIATQLGDVEMVINQLLIYLTDSLSATNDILAKHPQSPRGLYIKAKLLDELSIKMGSDEMLEESFWQYNEVLQQPDIPDTLFKLAVNRMVEMCFSHKWQYKGLLNHQKRLLDLFPDDLKIRNQYAQMFLLSHHTEEAKLEFQKVLKIDPTNGFALKELGLLFRDDENYEEAVKYLSQAIESYNSTGNRDQRWLFFKLGESLERLGRNNEAYEIFDLGVEHGFFLSRYHRSFDTALASLESRPFWTPEQTTYQKYLEMIEAEWETIRDEGLALLDQDGLFLDDPQKITKSGVWKKFVLWHLGQKQEDNCAKTPKTCALLEKVPAAIGCMTGIISFSVFYPGTHVWTHCGPTNSRLRAQLGLVIPPEPRIRVGNETKSWTEGKFIILDDSFEHEVWHHGNEGIRLILIVDFWHPQLTDEQKASTRLR